MAHLMTGLTEAYQTNTLSLSELVNLYQRLRPHLPPQAQLTLPAAGPAHFASTPPDPQTELAHLRHQHRLFEHIFDLSADFAYITQMQVNGQPTTIWDSGKFELASGHVLKHVVDAYPLLHPDDLPRFQENVAKLLAGQESLNDEYRFVLSEDETAHWSFSSRPLLDEVTALGLGCEQTVQEVGQEDDRLYHIRNKSGNYSWLGSDHTYSVGSLFGGRRIPTDKILRKESKKSGCLSPTFSKRRRKECL